MTQPSHKSSSGETIVVVPCFNEAWRLGVVAFERFLSSSEGVSLLLVDDGSTDDTPLVHERLRQRHPRRVMTLRLAANSGKAEAVRRGLLLAIRRRAEFVGYWDADLATPLGTIEQFASVLRGRPELMLVMGSRVALLGRQIRRRWRRHVAGRAFATVASIVLRLPVYDTQCGAKLFRVTPQLTDVFGRRFQTRWIFDVEILARLASVAPESAPLHETIYEYPLDRWQDVQGSRLTTRDFATAALDLAAVYWREVRGSRRTAVAAPSNIEHRTTNIEHRDAA
jgi:glycosyltransferase involved in cell wall biosynthesis